MNPKCNHECDAGPVPFCYTCTHCKAELEPEWCKICDGMGELIAESNAWESCKACNGTGVEEWRLA